MNRELRCLIHVEDSILGEVCVLSLEDYGLELTQLHHLIPVNLQIDIEFIYGDSSDLVPSIFPGTVLTSNPVSMTVKILNMQLIYRELFNRWVDSS